MKLRSILLAGFLFVALPLAPSFAQIISVNFAPPPLPVLVQPPCPVEGYIWTPGYWDWDGSDYYLVPGAWVPPPAVGLLWTPPWWGWNNGVYAFNEGYWGPTVGFYGGINYGFGYFGDGYWGGRWQGGTFVYNTAVTHVDTTVIHNTFVDKSVLSKQINTSHASFNGPNGVKAEATAEQKAAEAHKIPPTSQQLAHKEAATKDPKLHASVNKGHPSPDAIKSFNQTQGKGVAGTGTAATGKGGQGVGAAATGKGAQGTGAAATGAGTGKAEKKTGKVSEQGLGAGAETGAQHGKKHTAENVYGKKQNLGGVQGKGYSGKPPGYTASAYGQPGTMQGSHYQQKQMGAYHPQTGTNQGHATGQQQQQSKKKKPDQGGPHGPY